MDTHSQVHIGEYIEIGRRLTYLINIPHPQILPEDQRFLYLASNATCKLYRAEMILSDIKRLQQLLETNRLPITAGTTFPFAYAIQQIDDLVTKRPEALGEMLPEVLCNHIASIASSIFHALKVEAASIFVATLDPNILTDPISTFRDKVNGTSIAMQDWQSALWDDTIRCLQIGAYRPAIIVGWSCGFDMLRYWVFNDAQRLGDFNAVASARGIGAISAYHDFFSMKENQVLDFCRIAGGSLADFTEKIQRRLQHILDERNEFGHANFRQATSAGAQALLEKMIAILTSKPFLP